MAEGEEVEMEPSSGVPPEYCEFLPKSEFKRALPWLVKNRDTGAACTTPTPPPPLFSSPPRDAPKFRSPDLPLLHACPGGSRSAARRPPAPPAPPPQLAPAPWGLLRGTLQGDNLLN